MSSVLNIFVFIAEALKHSLVIWVIWIWYMITFKGFDYLSSLEPGLFQLVSLVLFTFGVTVEMLLRRSNNQKNITLTANLPVAAFSGSFGLEISNTEARKLGAIPWFQEFEELMFLHTEINKLEYPSEIHDRKILNALGIEKQMNVTKNIDEAKKLLPIRFGNIKSALEWDVKLQELDNYYRCELSVKSKEGRFEKVNTAYGKMKSSAIICSILQRERNIYKSSR